MKAYTSGTVLGFALVTGLASPIQADEIDVSGSWQINVDCGLTATATYFVDIEQAPGTGLLTMTIPECGTLGVPGGIHRVSSCEQVSGPDGGLVSGNSYEAPTAPGFSLRDSTFDPPVPFYYTPVFDCDVSRILSEQRFVGAISDDGFGAGVEIQGTLTTGVVEAFQPFGNTCFRWSYPSECSFQMLRNDVSTGSSVTVVPLDGTSVTFETVSSPGRASVVPLTTPDAIVPSSFGALGSGGMPIFYDVTTTASISGVVTSCFRYPDANDDGMVDGSSPPLDEMELQVLHEEAGVFVDRTASRNGIENQVCAATTSLSQLVVGAPVADLPPPVSDEEGTVILYSSGDGGENPLYGPVGVAVGPSGNVYVSGAQSHNVFEIAPDGSASEILDASGDGMGRVLKHANAIAVGPDERVYVTGLSSDNAFRIEPDGTVTEILDASGDGLGHTVDQPSSLAVDLFGNVWVGASVSDNVFRIASSGSVEEVLGPSYGQPSAIVADGLGNVYIATRTEHSVYKIAPDGAVRTALGRSGADGVPFSGPTGMALDAAHNVYVTADLGRTFRITSDGQASFLFDETADGSGLSLRTPLSLATDGLGNLFVASLPGMNIVRRSPFGELEEVFIGQPIQLGGYGIVSSIACDAAGNLYMARSHADVVARLVPEASGPLGQGAALFLVLLLGRRRQDASRSRR